LFLRCKKIYKIIGGVIKNDRKNTENK